MPALQVRDFPQDLYEELRDYAARNHRSIAQQTIACVESELKRMKAVVDSGEPAVPSNVREGAEQARFVDAFGWMHALRAEMPAERKERMARRDSLRDCFSEVRNAWRGPIPSCDDIALMVRAERDGRADGIIADASGFLRAAQEV